MTTRLGARSVEAFGYAAEVHADQTRKGSETPYISHLLAVTATVLEDGGDEEEAIAALLHDAAEDQGGAERLDDIRERFGGRVADIVEGCSDTLTSPKPPWKERKTRYLDHLRTAPPEVLRVSLADKLHNARTMLHDHRILADALWERFHAPAPEQLWYLGSLVEVFRERRPGPLTEEFARTVGELRSRVFPDRSPASPTAPPARRTSRPEHTSATETFFQRLVEPPPGPPSWLERAIAKRIRRG